MGTHPSSPSRLLSDTNASLASHLADHPDLIGQTVSKQFANEGTKEGNLPFLFKVLAIEKALSIQTHPDKATAEKLHKEKPNVYKGGLPLTLSCGTLVSQPSRVRCQPQTRDGNRINAI